ncbi:MAG: hypothetical protein Q8Q92_03760, partial [bacterium]|nr:hypothetical protein [bacterium]
LYPFVDIFSNACDSVAPFLGCKNTGSFVSWVFSSLGLLFWSFVGFPWLVKQSYLFIVSVIVSLALLMVIGFFILKHRYNELINVEPSI